MDNEIKTWLFDILNSIEEIESFFLDRPKRFMDYRNDLRTKRLRRAGGDICLFHKKYFLH
jgi:hypothetical protein